MKGMIILLSLILVCFATNNVSAQSVEFSDFSTDAIIIDFDFRTDGTPIPGHSVPPYSGTIFNPASLIDDDFILLGVTFSSTNGSPVVAVHDTTNQLAGISSPNAIIGTLDPQTLMDNGPIFAHFFSPVTGLPSTTTQVGAFSKDVDISPVSFIAYDSSGIEVGRTFFQVGGDGSVDFAGLKYSDGIAGIAINVPSTDWFAIDDFIFEPVAVPVPGAVWLLGSGMAGIAGFRIRRKQK